MRRPARPSFAGTGLLERMRSTTFAILGIAAAMGLGLVAIASQQGLPVLPGLPIPGAVGEQQEKLGTAKPVAAPNPSPGLGPASAAPAPGSDGGGAGTPAVRPENAALSGSRQLASSPNSAPDGAGEEVPSGEAPVAPVPAVPAPSEAPAPTPAPEPTPAAVGAVDTPPGKGTAALDPSAGGESVDSAQAQADEAATRGRRPRGGPPGGGPARGELPPVPAPPQVPSEADAQAAAEAAPTASQAEVAAERSSRGGRGHGYRRSGR